MLVEEPIKLESFSRAGAQIPRGKIHFTLSKVNYTLGMNELNVNPGLSLENL